MKSASRLKIGFLLAILLLSLNLLLPQLMSRQTNALLDRYESLEALQRQVQQLLSALKDGETGQRGFVITGPLPGRAVTGLQHHSGDVGCRLFDIVRQCVDAPF